MKLKVLLFLILLGGMLIHSPFLSAASQGEDPYEPNQVVVFLLPGVNVATIAGEYGLNPTPIDQFGTRPIYLLEILDGTPPPVKAEQLLNDPALRVEAADANYTGEIPENQQLSEWAVGGSGADYIGQWAPDTMELPGAHAVATGEGIQIAVLDTGIDATHPELAGHVLPGFDFVDFDNDPSEEGNHEDNFGFGHGTHVAGLIALSAPDAKIIPIRILDPDGIGNMWVLFEGLEYAVQVGADVINLSFAFTRQSDALEEIIEGAICEPDRDPHSGCLFVGQQSIVVVASAGNRGDQIPEYPAAIEEEGILAVAASTVFDTLAWFSSRGPWVHVAAPGANILSTVPGGLYATWNGTSMSAPLSAGVAALVREQQPLLPPSAVVQRIVTTADIINDPTVPRRINARAAVGAPPLPPTPTPTGTPPTSTPTATTVPPTSTPTATGVPPTATATATGVPPTVTPTATGAPPTVTVTATGTPPTVTATATATGVPPTATTAPSGGHRLYLPLVRE